MATIDLRRAAVPGLRTISHTRRGGRVLQVPWPASERQVYFPTKDGRLIYLMRHAVYYEHLSKLLAFLDCSPDSAAIARATARWDAAALEDALAERKLMGTVVRSFAEWNDSPQGRHLAPRVPVEIERIGDSDPVPFTPGPRPLSGIKVVDMAHVLAGPVTSRVLAEQGAEVIHVSAPYQPDPVHVVIDTGFGKRSAYVDLDRAEDVASVLRLIDTADIFAHSWRPGSLDRRGLSPAELARRRPGLIYVSVSCYGYDGPWAERAGYDPLGQVASGLAAGEGSMEAPLMASTFTLNDYLAAYLASAGINSALLRRAREGGKLSRQGVVDRGIRVVAAARHAAAGVLAGWRPGRGEAAGPATWRTDHDGDAVRPDRAPAADHPVLGDTLGLGSPAGAGRHVGRRLGRLTRGHVDRPVAPSPYAVATSQREHDG